MASFMPIGSQRLSIEEARTFLEIMITLHEKIAETNRHIDVGLLNSNFSQASQYRELRWTISEGDEIWLSAEPPENADFIHGSIWFAVFRNGNLLFKHRIINA